MKQSEPTQSQPGRRNVVASLMMGVGLVLGYGAGAMHFFRYLVPLRLRGKTRDMFVGTLSSIPVGRSLTIRDPKGHKIAVTRTADHPDAPEKGFNALSSTCPHLGCQVHWQAGSQTFYCPCHDGRFDKNGIAISGPPAQEGKNLSMYQANVDRASGNVYVAVSAEGYDRA